MTIVTDNTAVIRALEKRVEELERIGEIRQDILEIQEARIEELEAENQRLRDALTEIGDVCYSISKTRAIVKAALLGGGEK